MIERSVIEQAYAFFHQKLKVYEHSTSEREMDHIEDTISAYADTMSLVLFEALSGGNKAFLHEHTFLFTRTFVAPLLIWKTN